MDVDFSNRVMTIDLCGDGGGGCGGCDIGDGCGDLNILMVLMVRR